MTYNRQRRGERSGKRTFIYGIIFTALSFLILALTASLILSKLKDPLGGSWLASISVLLMTGAATGFFITKYRGEGSFLLSFLCSGSFAILLFSIGMIACKGKIASVTAINLISYVAATVIFATLAKKKRKTRKRR